MNISCTAICLDAGVEAQTIRRSGNFETGSHRNEIVFRKLGQRSPPLRRRPDVRFASDSSVFDSLTKIVFGLSGFAPMLDTVKADLEPQRLMPSGLLVQGSVVRRSNVASLGS